MKSSSHSGVLSAYVIPPGSLRRRSLKFLREVAVRRPTKFMSKWMARGRFGFGLSAFSNKWGMDRGLPVHRYYLESFLEEHKNDVRGDCLEFECAFYVHKFGGARVRRADVMHVDGSNPNATIVADLTKSNSVESSRFDCIICTHVLHVIANLDTFISEIYRILRPGGVLLVAAPQLSMCDRNWHELWRFTPEGMETVLARAFGRENVSSRSYGNSLVAAGEIRGLASDDFTRRERAFQDPRFGIEVCARAVKPAGGDRPQP